MLGHLLLKEKALLANTVRPYDGDGNAPSFRVILSMLLKCSERLPLEGKLSVKQTDEVE